MAGRDKRRPGFNLIVRVVVYFHEEGLSHQEILVHVQPFALQLAETDAQKARFQARLAALATP